MHGKILERMHIFYGGQWSILTGNFFLNAVLRMRTFTVSAHSSSAWLILFPRQKRNIDCQECHPYSSQSIRSSRLQYAGDNAPKFCCCVFSRICTLQHTATQLNALPHTTGDNLPKLRCCILSRICILQNTATHCNTHQRAATHCRR